MWRGMAEPDRPQMIILYGARALHAGWPYRNTLGIIILMAFPQQQWFRTYTACPVFIRRLLCRVSDIWHILYFNSSCVSHMSCDIVEVLRTLTRLCDSEWWGVFSCIMWGNSAPHYGRAFGRKLCLLQQLYSIWMGRRVIHTDHKNCILRH